MAARSIAAPSYWWPTPQRMSSGRSFRGRLRRQRNRDVCLRRRQHGRRRRLGGKLPRPRTVSFDSSFELPKLPDGAGLFMCGDDGQRARGRSLGTQIEDVGVAGNKTYVHSAR